jgi:hypothetical protein
VEGIKEGTVFLCESCQMRVNDSVEFVGQRREIVVDVRYWVHGMKRGGGRSVREEDRHPRQVLVTVELSFVLCKNANPVQLLVHACEVE